MASRFEEDGERAKPYEPHSKETIANKLAPKGKPKAKLSQPKFDGPNPDFGEEYPSELRRERYQLISFSFANIRDRIVSPGSIVKDDQGVDYWFKAITGDSNTGYFLTVRPTAAGLSDQTRTIKDFPGYGVQGNPLYPYTFEARVLPALTEYRKVKASGLGVDRVARMLMDAVMFLADERVTTLEAHEAFKAEMLGKLDKIEALIKEERDAR